MGNKSNYIQVMNTLHLFNIWQGNRDSNNEQNPEKWICDYFASIFVTGINFTLRQIANHTYIWKSLIYEKNLKIF